MMKRSSAPAGVPGDRGLRNRAVGRSLLLAALVTLPISVAACFSTRPAKHAVPAAPETLPAIAASQAVLAVPPVPLDQPAPPPEPPAEQATGATAAPGPAPAVLPWVAGLSPRALGMAFDAVACARARGVAGRSDLLTIIDYSRPSTEPRLWVLDLARGRVLFHELVAHGTGSGDNYATRFSNLDDSRQTSLGLYLTRDTYEGGNGYSLKLQGLDAGVNDRAEERKIVMHGAWYVSPGQIQRYGRIGRSWGCPALPVEAAHRVIDAIKGGSFLFAYTAADGGWMHAASAHRCAPERPPIPPAPTLPTAAPLATAAAGR
jgi:hypothetical protein